MNAYFKPSLHFLFSDWTPLPVGVMKFFWYFLLFSFFVDTANWRVLVWQEFCHQNLHSFLICENCECHDFCPFDTCWTLITETRMWFIQFFSYKNHNSNKLTVYCFIWNKVYWIVETISFKMWSLIV